MVEFAYVIAMLMLFFVIPSINIGAIPLRFFFAQRVVTKFVHRLSLSERLSDAFTAGTGDSELSNALSKLGGVDLLSSELTLSIAGSKSPEQEKIVDCVGKIPPEWLPNGANGPYSYFLHLKVRTNIYPLLVKSIAGKSIPALNGPLPLTIEEVAHWENLGRDPASGEFYVNE